MRILAVALALLAFGCSTSAPDPDLEGPQDEPTQAAETTLRLMAEAQFPREDAGVVAQCGILNTTTEELQTLAGAGTETDEFLARATAAGVFAKPETRACLRSNGVTL